MQTKEAIKNTYEISAMVLNGYTGDMTDQEIMMRPAEGCNHIAWQMGHLISSEANLLNSVCPDAGIELPQGFEEKHGKENASSDDAGDFLAKDAYLELFAKSKEATFKALDGLSDEDLDKPGPEHMRDFCPTVGSMFVLIATHPMMHVGQFVPLRRKLEKPIVI